MEKLLVGEGIDALAKLTSGLPSFFTLDSSNLSAMSFCMSLNLGLWCSPISDSFFPLLPIPTVACLASAAARFRVSFVFWDSRSTFKLLTLSNSSFNASTSDCKLLIKFSLTSSFSCNSFLFFPSGSSSPPFLKPKSPSLRRGRATTTTSASSASLPFRDPTAAPLLALETSFKSRGTDLALVDDSGGDFGVLEEALRRGCGGLCRDLLLSPCFFNAVLAMIGEDGVFCFITEKGLSDER
ncbi:hypothetical protein V8G54_016778 [Vigna mungo]|uniref:Uncharacterized protein n=1 Tax=Vigna mungo TaxID=3915 RepID=A0AAQ3NPS2_VIGMU